MSYQAVYMPRRQKARGLKKRDVLYLLLYTLIVVGLTSRIQARAVKQAQALVGSVKAQAHAVITPTPKTVVVQVIKEDVRVSRLQQYLEKNTSPLAPFAAFIIEKSDENAIDWTLIVSIAGKESTLGKNCKQSCHNPFGLGGTKPMCFDSWEAAIEYEAKLLSNHYRAPMISGIQPIYCPSFECSDTWTKDVLWFSKSILAVNEK